MGELVYEKAKAAPPILLGLFGPPRAGKDTICRVLKGFGFEHLSIGQAIKDASHELVGRKFADAEKDASNPWLSGKTPRQLYIHVGNLDDYTPHVWADRVVQKIEYEPGRKYVIDSIGKQHQWDYILSKLPVQYIYLVEVRRPGHTWKGDSRSAIRDYLPPYVINNEGNVTDLKDQIRCMLHFFEIEPRPRIPGQVLRFLKEKEGECSHSYQVSDETPRKCTLCEEIEIDRSIPSGEIRG